MSRALLATVLVFLAAPIASRVDAQDPPDPTLRFSVQIVAGPDLDAAVEAAAQWSTANRPVYVAPVEVNGTVYYRILAGLLQTREDARTLMAQLVREGVKSEAAEWHIRGTDQAFRLGEFQTPAVAAASGRDLLTAGIPSYVVTRSSGNGVRYLLYAGGYANAEEATYLSGRLETLGFPNTLATRLGLGPAAARAAEARAAAAPPPVEEVDEVEEPPVEEVVDVEEPPVEEAVDVEEPPVEEAVDVEEPPVEEAVDVEEPPVEEAVDVEEPPTDVPPAEITSSLPSTPAGTAAKRVIRRAPRRSVRPHSFGAGLEHQYFSFDTPGAVGFRSLTLTTMPVGARLVFPREIEVEIQAAYARGYSIAIGGARTEIAGPTDTRARVTVPLGPFSISGDVVVPTGEVTYDFDQVVLAGAFAADLLPFRISNWGAGGGVGVSAGFAEQIGTLGVAISGGVFTAGEFDPVEGTDAAYRPGNNLSGRIAIDHAVGGSGKLTLLGSLQVFDDDAFDGENLYRSGNRFQVLGSYAFAVGPRHSAIFYGGWLRRSEGSFLLQQSSIAPALDLAIAGLALRLRQGRMVIVPRFDGRALRNAAGRDQGYTARLGLSAELPILGDFKVIPFGRGHLGSVEVMQGLESVFTGWDAGITLRFEPPR